MSASGLVAEPVWKQFLHFGEELLKQATTAAQCQQIATTVTEMLAARASVWLAEPFYPLPGETSPPPLLSAQAPAHVQAVLASRDLSRAAPESLAVPLINQENLLGVLAVERPGGPAFTSTEIDLLDGLAAHAASALQINRQIIIKNWRYEQLTLVRSVNAQIANLLDLDELCQQVTHLIQHSFHYDYVAIFTTAPQNGVLHFRASAGRLHPSGQPVALTPRLGEGIIGLVAERGEEHLARDVHRDPHYHPSDYLPNTRSEVALPIKVEQRILGVLDVQSAQLEAFHEIDMLVLRSLADTIAIAVENARLYSDLRNRAEQMSAVVEVSHALSSILDQDQLLTEIVQSIHKRFGYPFVHLFTVHPGRRKIIFQAGSGERSQSMQKMEIMYDLDDPRGIIPWVARNGQAVLANDVSQDTRYRPSALPPYDIRSELCVPLMLGNGVQGILDLQSDQLYAFNASDRTLFEALGAGIAIALRNAALYRTEKWRRQVADSFRDVAYLLSSNTAVETLLASVLDQLERNLPCEAAAIWLLEEDPQGQRRLQLAVVRHLPPEALLQALERNQTVRTWLDQAMQYEHPTIRQPGDPYGPLGAALQFPASYSSIAAPLSAGGQTLGVITLAHHSPGRYGSEASTMAATFASYAAVAIQNAGLYSQAQEQAWVSTVLLQVAEATQAIDTLDELLATMTRLTPLLVGIKKSAIFLWEDSLQTFELKSWYGLDLPVEQRLFAPQDVPALAQLQATRATIFVQDATRELNLPAAAMASRDSTLVILPLLTRGEILGAFLVAHQASRTSGAQPFDHKTLSILQGIAHQTAVAIENVRLLDARQEEAYVTAVLLQVAQAVVSQNNLNDILDTIIHLVPILVGVEVCIIYLWNEQQRNFAPAQVYAGSRQQENELLTCCYEAGEFALLDAVRKQDSPLVCPLPEIDLPPAAWSDLPCTPVSNELNPPGAAAEKLLAGFPLSVKGQFYGVLLAKETGASVALREKRMEIITGIAQQVALAIQNERMQQEMVERERIEREFQLARQIQQTFLPSQLPALSGWQLDASWQTARQVGGDFYDIFALDEDHIGLVIADVSDKGLPAALYMTVTRTLLRANAPKVFSPAAVLERVNTLLMPDSQNNMFITTVYAILDLQAGQLCYANAGHNRPLLRHAGGRVEVLPKGGIALGILEEIHLVDHEVSIAPGDTLLLYTDGVTECFSASEEGFGEQRLHTVLEQDGDVPALLAAITQALQNFRQGAQPSDDVTLLALRRLAGE